MTPQGQPILTLQGQPIEASCYYFKLRVKNSGEHRAEWVEVFAAELLKKQADGSFKKMDLFLPMDLLWSHSKKPFIVAISPEIERHCTLGHIISPKMRSQFPSEDNPQLGISDNETIFCFDTEVRPNTLCYLVPPGTYRMVLIISAANTKPVKKTVEINHTGKWYDEESEMFSKGIEIRIL